MAHPFLLSPGIWDGEGQVAFNASPDIIPFSTQWEITPLKDGEILAIQKVEMEGTDEILLNRFRLFSVSPTSFSIELTNDLLGTVQGTGTINDKQIGWEFRSSSSSSFDGFEAYRLENQGEYKLHAEYASPDQYRTIIDGQLKKR